VVDPSVSSGIILGCIGDVVNRSFSVVAEGVDCVVVNWSLGAVSRCSISVQRRTMKQPLCSK
jgi:hypothetical protein